MLLEIAVWIVILVVIFILTVRWVIRQKILHLQAAADLYYGSYRIGSNMNKINPKRKLCEQCNKVNGDKRCGGCREAYYCSQECQRLYWKVHKSHCKKIREKKKIIKSRQNNDSNTIAKRLFGDDKLDIHDNG